MFLPRLPHTDVKLLLFAPDAARSVTEKQTQQATQTKEQEPKDERKDEEIRVPSIGLSHVKLCDTAASVH